ncbi:MAG: hypothetical protein ABL879_15425 [Devosia sp.]
MALEVDNKKRRDSEVIDGNLRPVGYEQITSLGTATALTVPLHARMALISAETQDVRWRDDDTDPTSSVGMPLTVDFPFWYTGDLAAFKVIEQTASATLNVTYYA